MTLSKQPLGVIFSRYRNSHFNCTIAPQVEQMHRKSHLKIVCTFYKQTFHDQSIQCIKFLFAFLDVSTVHHLC